MTEFGDYLKQLRVKHSLTQKELSARINLLGEEFLGIDDVSISRWERGVTTPHPARTIKILRSLTNDLLPYLLSLPIANKEHCLDEFAAVRFQSADAIWATATYQKKSPSDLIEIQPIIDNARHKDSLTQLENFLDHIGEVELPRHGIDFYGCQAENKLLGKKLINSVTQEIQGHILSFYFDAQQLDDYYDSLFLPFPAHLIKSYQPTRPMALFTVTRYSLAEGAFWTINSLLSFLLASQANIHHLYFYVFDPLTAEYMERLGADKMAYHTPDEGGMIKLGRQSYRFGLFRLDTASWLSRPEMLLMLQEASHDEARFNIKRATGKTVAQHLLDEVSTPRE